MGQKLGEPIKKKKGVLKTWSATNNKCPPATSCPQKNFLVYFCPFLFQRPVNIQLGILGKQEPGVCLFLQHTSPGVYMQHKEKTAFKRWRYLEILAAEQENQEEESKREKSNNCSEFVILKAQSFLFL